MTWAVVLFASSAIGFVLSFLLWFRPPLAGTLGFKADRWAYRSWQFWMLYGGVFFAAGLGDLLDSPWRAVCWSIALLGMVASALIDHAWRKRRAARG